MLWSEDDGSPARHRLSQLLYSANRRAGVRPLFKTDTIQIRPNYDEVHCDLDEFHALLLEGRVLDAATLASREFLPILSGTLTDEFEDWRGVRIAQLRTTLSQASRKVWATAEGGADWMRAREAAEVLLKLEPNSPAYLEYAMKAAMLSGDIAGARTTRDEWIEHNQGSSAPPLPHFPSEELRNGPHTSERYSTQFVGRGTEYRRLLQAIRRAPRGVLSSISVTGEAGIGKTRIVDEACNRAVLDGIPVFRARCSPLEQQIPLNALADALQGTKAAETITKLASPWREVIQQFLPGSHPPTVKTDPGLLTRQVFEATRQLLQMVSVKPTILWIDDFQWIDQTTSAALEFAARRWTGGTLIIVASTRTGDSDANLNLSPSLRPLVSLEIGPLPVEDALTMAQRVLGRTLRKDETEHFLVLTDQVPLFVIELAHEWARGRLVPGETLEIDRAFFPTIEQIVDERIAVLGPLERQLLEFVAVAEHIQLHLIEDLVRGDHFAIMEALGALVDLRLVLHEESQVRCRHELLRQCIYKRLTVTKRQLLHGVVARVLSQSSPDHDCGQIALHFHRAASRAEALQFALRAALKTEGAGASHEATKFIEIARLNASDKDTATALLEREALIRYREADFERALPLLTHAAAERRGTHEAERAIGWTVQKLHTAIEVGAVETTVALEELDGVLSECRTNGFWERYIEGIECRLRILERDNKVVQLRETIRRLSTRPSDVTERVECLWDSARALSITFSDGEGALTAAKRAYEITTSEALSDLRDRVLHRLIFVHFSGGSMDAFGGRELLDSRLRLPLKSDSLKGRYGFLEAAGLWHLELGEYRQAEDFFVQAEDVLEPVADVSDKVHMLANRGEQLALGGELKEARDYYSRARAALKPHHYWRTHQVVYGGLGYCALQLGELRLAHECEEALEYRDESYFDPWIIILFKATAIRRRSSDLYAADYLSSMATHFDGRLRTVPIKARLIELRLRKRADVIRAREIGEWLVEETARLNLWTRSEEAQSLLSSLPNRKGR